MGRCEKFRREAASVRDYKTTRFNIVTFSDGVSSWDDRVESASRKQIKKASRFVSHQAPQKGTNTHGALQQALLVPGGAKPDEIADTILFLSDGSPSTGRVVDPRAILMQVREWNRYRRVRIHTIALLTGDPPDRFGGQDTERLAQTFIRLLAEMNGGSADVIE